MVIIIGLKLVAQICGFFGIGGRQKFDHVEKKILKLICNELITKRHGDFFEKITLTKITSEAVFVKEVP